jgi:NSS family neurotransmitter:Na+ symporter
MAYVTQRAGNPVAVSKVAEGGPSLAFVAFPYALAQLPYSAWFSFIFFFALVTLGIDSAFSITESVLASIVDKTGWRRSVVLPLMSMVGLGFGLVYITNGGLNWLGTIDGFVNGTWGIAFLGLLECVVLGWLWRVGTLRRHANSRSDWQLGKWWDYLIRIVIPIVLGTLFFWQLFDDLGSESGFLRGPDGQWIVPNCVGLAVVWLAPVLAVVFSVARGREDNHIAGSGGGDLEVKGGLIGAISVLLAGVPSLLFVVMVSAAGWPGNKRFEGVVLWALLVGGVTALLLSNYVVEKENTSSSQASWFARWGGIAATMNLSAFTAVVLFRLTHRLSISKAAEPFRDKLSGVSYVILTVVFLIIIGGLGWCFYRALMAAGKTEEPQSAEEIGDESQVTAADS